MPRARKLNRRRRGAALILSLVCVLLFSALAVSRASLTGTNVQIASNQRRVRTALYAAQSGLECAKYIVTTNGTTEYFPHAAGDYTTKKYSSSHNQSSVQKATILAPHFNVNLGNTNPNQGNDNIGTGATLDDGGSETTEMGDVGTIDITPEEDMMLPSGITSPIIIKPKQDSYCESA